MNLESFWFYVFIMVVHYLRGAGWYHVLTILFRFSFSHLRIHIIYFTDVRTLVPKIIQTIVLKEIT